MFENKFVGPCGSCACEKYADCAYCAVCIENHPWAKNAHEANEDARWERENAGSFGDWFGSR